MITQSTFGRLAFVAALFAGSVSLASAQDSGPLIDALVRKGILTDQEGEELRADLLRDFGTSSPGKLEISSAVTKLKIAGDARVRYQYDNEQSNAPASDTSNKDRSRYRYRLRLGMTANLGSKWSSGFRIETSNGATSTNNDFGSVSAPPGSTTAAVDNFSKNSDGVYFGQVFVQYNDIGLFGSEGVDVRLGKFAHKFFVPGVNGFWIDSDINFEGAAEELVYEDVIGATDIALRSGQFLLNANSTAGSKVNSPSALFITQAEVSRVSQANGAGWRVAPTFVAFAAPSDHDAGVAQNNDSAIYTDLATVLVPAEYVFILPGGTPLAVYGAYGVNLQGDERSGRLYGAANSASDQMFNAGLRYGAAKLAGDYQLTAEYRYVGAGAYTSILLDSDFNAGRLGGEGPILSASYNFTDAIVGTITYFNSFNIDPDQPVNTGTNGLGFGKAQVLQVDLSAKF